MLKLLNALIILVLFCSQAEAVVLFGDNSTQVSEDFVTAGRSYGDTYTASAATGTYENVILYVRWGTTNGTVLTNAAIYDSSDNLIGTGTEDTGITDGSTESYVVSGTVAITNGATYRIAAAANSSAVKIRHDGAGGQYDDITSYSNFPSDPFSVTATAFGDINAWAEGDLVSSPAAESNNNKVIMVTVAG